MQKILNMAKKQKLYHLSEFNHNGEVFKPRVPETFWSSYWGCPEEDVRTKRVCFSKTISGAFLAIDFKGKYKTLYLHVPENIDDIPERKIIVPTKEQVPDAEFTREIWIKHPVKMKCIAKIQIGYNERNNKTFWQWRPSVKFKYIERY